MPKVYLLGGENIAKRDAKPVNELAFDDAGQNPSILVFPWASKSIGWSAKNRELLTEYFEDIGAGVVFFIEYSFSFRKIARKADDSDLIYLPGGFTTFLIERFRNKKMDLLLKEYEGVIVGRSAGALALCKRCVLTRKGKDPKTFVIEGLNLVSLTAKVHYKPSRDVELKSLSQEEAIYAIAERSALVCDKGVLSSLGNVFLFENGKKKQVG